MLLVLLLLSVVFSLGMKCLSCIIRSKLCIYGPSLRTPMCDFVSYGDGVLLYPLVHFTKNLLIELVVGGLQAALWAAVTWRVSSLTSSSYIPSTLPHHHRKSQLAPQDSNRSQAIRIIFALIEFLPKNRLSVWGWFSGCFFGNLQSVPFNIKQTRPSNGLQSNSTWITIVVTETGVQKISLV